MYTGGRKGAMLKRVNSSNVFTLDAMSGLIKNNNA